MKRLTTYICDRAHGAEGVSENNLTGTYCRGSFEATAIVDRLAKIEDILGDEYDLDRLREIVSACNLIGEKVYINQWWHNGIRIDSPPIEKTVYNVLISKRGGALLQFKDGAFHTSHLGKKIFTSKEAAETALAKEADHP